MDTAVGWSASAHRQDHDGLSEKRAHQLHLTCGLQIALILIQWITLFGVLFSNESTTNDSSRRWKTEASDSHRVAKTLTAFH